MNILIVGAGISGLAAGNILHDQGIKAEIVEAAGYVGGLIHCETVSGYLYHRVGGHVFNSKEPKVLDWFWGKFNREKEFVQVERNAKILLGNKYIGYPIENHIYQFDPMLARSIIKDLVYQPNVFKKTNFDEFLSSTFGKTLCDMYFFPYNEKIWQCSLKEVSIEWLEGKLPSPDVTSVIVDNIFRQKEHKMVHSNFYYPMKGGSQFIVDRLAKDLNIKTNCPVEKILILKNGLEVDGIYYDKVIYTGDIRKLSSIIDTDDEELRDILSELATLMSHGTSNLLCECDPTNLSWLYLPDRTIMAHRIIYTGSFSELNNRSSGRSSCVVEFSGYVSHETMCKEIISLPGNLCPLASNYQKVSYVIHDATTGPKVDNAIRALNSVNIFPLGRFAEWQYYNMDKAIASAMNLVDSW